MIVSRQDMKLLLKGWKCLEGMKLINTNFILGSLVLHLKLFNHINPYNFRARTLVGAKAPHIEVIVQRLARGIAWTQVLFKFVRCSTLETTG